MTTEDAIKLGAIGLLIGAAIAHNLQFPMAIIAAFNCGAC